MFSSGNSRLHFIAVCKPAGRVWLPCMSTLRHSSCRCNCEIWSGSNVEQVWVKSFATSLCCRWLSISVRSTYPCLRSQRGCGLNKPVWFWCPFMIAISLRSTMIYQWPLDYRRVKLSAHLRGCLHSLAFCAPSFDYEVTDSWGLAMWSPSCGIGKKM